MLICVSFPTKDGRSINENKKEEKHNAIANVYITLAIAAINVERCCTYMEFTSSNGLCFPTSAFVSYVAIHFFFFFFFYSLTPYASAWNGENNRAAPNILHKHVTHIRPHENLST